MAKIKLSNRKREDIKLNFFAIDKSKLSKNELAYYNKVKAGKTRSGAIKSDKEFRGYRAANGQYMSKRFVDNNIIEVSKAMGLDAKKVFKANKEEIQRDYTTQKIDWSANEKTILNLDKNFRGKTGKIITGINKKDEYVYEELTTDEIKERFADFKAFLMWKAAREGTTIAAVILQTSRNMDNTEFTTQIPNKKQYKGMSLEEILEDISENYPDVTIIISERKSKKKKQRNTVKK